MTRKMEQTTCARYVQSPPGAKTDPTGITSKLENTVDQFNANNDRMLTLFGQLYQRFPTVECSREERKAALHDPTGTRVWTQTVTQ